MRGKCGHKRKKLADGGLIRGPGTGTSDDIDMEMPEGAYIMPADSTAQLGVGPLTQMGADQQQVPVSVSNGEFAMPPEQVHAVGVQALDAMRDQTHRPVSQNREQNPQQTFFADGGAVYDPNRRIYVDSAGRAVPSSTGVPSQSTAMVPAGPRTTTGMPAPAPQFNAQPSGPALASGNAQPRPIPGSVGGDYAARANAMHNRMRDTASYNTERLAQNKRFADAAKTTRASGGVQGLINQARPLGKSGALGTAIGAGVEGYDAYRVATDPESTALDAVTQGAEGASKVAGGVAGGLAGLAAGGPLGALAGGTVGYFAPEAAIKGLRWVTGQDTASPIDRVNARRENATVAGEYSEEPLNIQSAPEPQANNITRVGNSFSGTNIGPGFTINGQPSSEADPLMYHADNPAEAAAANWRAKHNLFENTPGWAGGNTGIPGAGGAPAAATAAPQSGGGGGGGGRGVAQLIRSSGTPSNAEILRERMRNQRDQVSQRGREIDSNANVRQQQVDLQGRVADAQLMAQQAERATAMRTAQRMEALRDRYQNAESQEERAAIALAIRDLLGQARPDLQIARSDRLADPGDPMSQVLSEAYIVDPDTRQGRLIAGGSAAWPTPPQNHINALMKNPALAEQFESTYGPGSAARYGVQ